MKKKTLIFSIILIAGMLVFTGCSNQQKSGGVYHTQQEDFPRGLSVGLTEVISSSRALSATTGTFSGAVTSGALTSTSMTAVNGTATSTAAVGSSAIGTKKGKLCVWNGSNYTLISFTANSTSTSGFATSSSCQ